MCTQHTDIHNTERVKHTHSHRPPNLPLHTVPTLNTLWKLALAKTTHTFSHKEFLRACSDNQRHVQQTHSVPNGQIFTARLSLKPAVCVGTVLLCVANNKMSLFQRAVMCSGGWERSGVHPIKRLPLVCVWFWATMRTMEAVGDNWPQFIQPDQWIPVRFPQVSASSFPGAV